MGSMETTLVAIQSTAITQLLPTGGNLTTGLFQSVDSHHLLRVTAVLHHLAHPANLLIMDLLLLHLTVVLLRLPVVLHHLAHPVNLLIMDLLLLHLTVVLLLLRHTVVLLSMAIFFLHPLAHPANILITDLHHQVRDHHLLLHLTVVLLRLPVVHHLAHPANLLIIDLHHLLRCHIVVLLSMAIFPLHLLAHPVASQRMVMCLHMVHLRTFLMTDCLVDLVDLHTMKRDLTAHQALSQKHLSIYLTTSPAHLVLQTATHSSVAQALTTTASAKPSTSSSSP
jgi:hypothetical protein